MSGLRFVDNIAAGVEALGLENAPLVYAMARVKWESREDRDAMLAWMGGKQNG